MSSAARKGSVKCCVFCSSVSFCEKKNVWEQLAEAFLSQSAQSSRSFLAHISSPQNASGIQRSQSVIANEDTIRRQKAAYIQPIGVSRWSLPFPSGEGPGEGPLSFWPLCVLFFCVLCEKKNICETRWGVLSLTERTEFTEPFGAQFELMRRWPLPQPLPRREGRNMWGYPYWAANTVLGYFFSHRTHRFNRTCGALFRTHRTPPAYRVHRGLSAIIITNKGHNEAYILFIGVSRWLLPFPSGEGPGEGPLFFWPLCVLFFCVNLWEKTHQDTPTRLLIRDNAKPISTL